MTILYSGMVFQIAILTSFRISCKFDGAIREIGKYPFAKILIAFAYMHSYIMNSSCIFTYFSFSIHKYKSEFLA